MGGFYRPTHEKLTGWTLVSGTGNSTGIVPTGSRGEVAMFHYTSTTANHSGIIRNGANSTNLWWVSTAVGNSSVTCSWSHPILFLDGISITVSTGGEWALVYRLVDTPA